MHTGMRTMLVCVAQVDRFSVAMPPEVGSAVRDAAEREGTSISAWLTDAAADRLRNDSLGAALDAWEAEDGALTDGELLEATRSLGLGAPEPAPDRG